MNSEDKLIGIIQELIEKAAPSSPFIIATVVTPPPNLTIKFREIIIPSNQIYCSNYLLPNYKRNYKIKGNIDKMQQDISKYFFENSTATEKDGQGPHLHGIKSLTGKGTAENTGSYETSGELWFTDTLVKDVEVLAIIVGKVYVVVDRITRMPSSAEEGGA